MKYNKYIYIPLLLIMFFIILYISNISNLTFYNYDNINSLNSSLNSSLSNINIERERCIINIKSSDKNKVVWDITDADADIVNVHCDFDEKKIFGGEVV